jgi:hypothetical protein
MRLNGRIRRKNEEVDTKFGIMIKYNIGHYKTLQDGLFPRFLPSGKTCGETNQGDELEYIKY